MAKKYGSKLAESIKKRARSSVGRAPQWHTAGPQKRKSLNNKFSFPKNAEVIEIPDGWEPVPAMRMVNGKPILFRVLLRTPPQCLENDLNGRKRRPRSA